MDHESEDDFISEEYNFNEDFEDNDEENGVHEQRHENMLAAVAAIDGRKRTDVKQRTEPSQTVSEFNLTEVGREKVKVYELLTNLKQSDTLLLKKQIRSASKRNQVLPTPLPKPAAERIKRAVAYEKVGDEVSKWDSVVENNRQSEHISFPLKQISLKITPATNNFVKGFKLKTPLELKIAELLQNSEHNLTDEKTLTVAEEKALKAMSFEEAQAKLGELRKIRALLSYKEIKARRQGKIKSKSYHRILKKERIRKEMKDFEILKETNPQLASDKLLETDRLRIEERMNLRHKSTGKWAKQHALRAKHDKDSRNALSEQLEVSRKLTKKVKLVHSDSEEEIAEANREENPTFSNEDHFQPLPLNFNPWIKDSHHIKATKSQEKNILAKEYCEEKDINIEDQANILCRGKVIDEDKVVEQVTERQEAVEEPNRKESLEVVNIGRTKKTSKKLKRKSNPFIVTDILEPAKKLLEDLNESSAQERSVVEDDCLTETLVQKRSLEDFQNMEERETFPQKRSIVLSESTSSGKPVKEVQIDPKKFVQVKTKRLEAKMPKVIAMSEECLDDESDDDEHRMTIAEAFEDDGVLEEFKTLKSKVVDDEKPKSICLALPGWGSWGGKGLEIPKKTKEKFTIPAKPASNRQDQNLGNVIINEKCNEKLSKHQVKELPFPFRRVEQYEKSIQQPIGSTWNPQTSFRDLIIPSVTTVKGEIIDPIDGDALILQKETLRRPGQAIGVEKIQLEIT